MLKIDKMTGGYRNIPVLKEISFEVPDGQLVGLIGLNGAGKSTTIKEIIGLLTPYQGAITIDDLSLGSLPEEDWLYSRNAQPLRGIDSERASGNRSHGL